MLNESTAVADDVLQVLDGIELRGRVNTDEDALLAHVRASIRRGHKQVQPYPAKPERVVILGGGPSLNDPRVQQELRDLLWTPDGDEDDPPIWPKLITVNGAYQWAIDHNFRPSAQIVMDARPHNARFLSPLVARCQYLLASQCHPDTFDAVEDYDNTWIFHAVSGDDDGALKAILDEYYLGQWVGIGGGTTVATRAITLLRTLGYLRFDLFGVDSCWLDEKTHHAYAQPENERDRRLPFKVSPTGHPELERTFWCSPWHVKQAEDFLQMIRVNGQHFKIAVHGDGLLAYLLKVGADAALIEQAVAEDV